MIDWLYDAATHRYAGAAAFGVATAMALYLWRPGAPQWFHLGGAFVVTTLLTGGVAEIYFRFISTVDDVVDEA